MNKKILIKTTITAGFLILAFQNCARSPFSSPDAQNSSATEDLSSNDGELAGSIAVPIAVMSGQQILASMKSVTGITTLSTSSTNEYNARVGSFPLIYDVMGTTAPMMIAVTSLGGDICNSLVTSEAGKAAATRTFLGGIDFTKPVANVTTAQFQTVINGFARNFWGRNATTTEMQILTSAVADFKAAMSTTTAASNASTNQLMLFLCSAQLSSVDAFTN